MTSSVSCIVFRFTKFLESVVTGYNSSIPFVAAPVDYLYSASFKLVSSGFTRVIFQIGGAAPWIILLSFPKRCLPILLCIE